MTNFQLKLLLPLADKRYLQLLYCFTCCEDALKILANIVVTYLIYLCTYIQILLTHP